MLIRYTINKKFETVTGQTVTISSLSADTVNSKYINIPINMESIPFDYTEDISKVVIQEREKAIYSKKYKNKPFDAETIKYTFQDNTANSNNGLLLEFRFWNSATKSYSTSYQNAGITSADTRDNSNAFKNSFFKLNFRNTNSGETNTTIFSEYINVFDTLQPKFYFNSLYWLRNDDFFIDNNNRVVYMDAKFFNAKTGKVHSFINIPLSIQQTNLPITIESYSEPNNRSWRSSAIEIVNPRLNNGRYNFRTVSPFGANTLTKITMSEFILK